jgi:hypothetical protein
MTKFDPHGTFSEEQPTMSATAIHHTLNERVDTALVAAGIDPADPDNSAEIISECRRQAEDAGFECVAGGDREWEGTSECDQCEVWENEAGERVNLWVVDVMGKALADGGLGFDDQTDWYEEQ